MKWTCYRNVVFCVLTLVAGCGKPSPQYYICMANRTPHDFTGVAVYYNGRTAAAAGNLVRGGEATDGYVTLPVPEEAEVRWDEAGNHHAVNVKAKRLIPDDPTDLLVFFIIEQDGSVTVTYARHDDIEARVKATQGVEAFRRPEQQ